MIVVDVDLLIYAVNQDSPDHHEAKSWLETAISGTETMGLPWIVLLSFLRLTHEIRTLSEAAKRRCLAAAAFCPNRPHDTCKRCVI